MILPIDAKDNMDGTCEQRKCFKEYGNKNEYDMKTQKETVDFSRARNEERICQEFVPIS